MYFIENVRVEGFWGRHVAEAVFHRDVNIFIGKNGTGKTTFMDLLQGALRADLRILGAHDSSEILIKLVSDGKHRTIRVTREKSDTPVELLRFQIGTRAFKFPLYSPEMDTLRHIRVRPRLAQEYAALQEQIAALVRVSSLSVHRTAFETTGEDDHRPHRHSARPPIDVRLDDLLRKLTSFRLSVAEEDAGVSGQFQRKVLESILFDPRYDTFSQDDTAVDLSQHKEQLSKAYQELGALTQKVSQRIASHVDAIENSLKAVVAFKQHKPSERPITIDELLPLPLLRRSQHIVRLLSDAEARKREVNRPIRDFETVFREFVTETRVDISPRGELLFEKHGKPITVSQLSSGDKQLVVLLTEALLQRNQPFVFLADEPELSLHIEWQAAVIGALQKLNGNAQVVVATHSPEIATGWRSRVVDMGDVIRG